MKNNFKWHKEQINGKWYSVCDHKHVPMIEHTKDGKYKLRNANGKAVLHEEYKDIVVSSYYDSTGFRAEP